MGLVERVQAQRTGRSFPFPTDVHEAERSWGHDASATFRPESYGDYVATSNAVYACATLRADLLSSVPIRFWKGDGEQRREVKGGPVRDLFRKVNPFWTFERLVNMTELSLSLWGEGFWFIERGPTGLGRPREMWWAKPTQVRAVPHPTEYIAGFLYYPKGVGEPIPFHPSEVLWLRYANPLDEYTGLSPIAAARLAADLESASAKSNKNLFEHGIQLGGVARPANDAITFTQAQAEELERTLDRRFRGVDKAHRWAVFRHQFDLQPMGVTPKDAEFLGSLGWSLDAIARAYRIPVEVLNGHDKTYVNFPTALKAVWQLAIQPEARFIAAEITEQILPMFGMAADAAEFDFRGVEALHADMWDRVLKAFEVDALGIEQTLELLGLEKRDGDLRKSQLTPKAPAPRNGHAPVETLTSDQATLLAALSRSLTALS